PRVRSPGGTPRAAPRPGAGRRARSCRGRMSLSSPFIHRPFATTLLTVAIALSGAIAYKFLPVSPLPQVEFPTISVQAGLPGASPDTMASSVATPLERQFGRIAGNLPNNPSYRKVNPADAPILILALTSTIIERARMY